MTTAFEETAQAFRNARQRKKRDFGDDRERFILPSKEFMARFVPPDYAVDGVAQRQFLYSFTGRTGSGKTSVLLRLSAQVAENQKIAGREVSPGRVIYLAGENPDDIRMRWMAMAQRMPFD